MKDKIFVALSTFAKSGKEPLNLLNESGIDYYINPLGRRITAEEILVMGSKATGIIAGLEPYSEEVLSKLPKLRCISRVGVGIDNIDQIFAKSKGIEIRNTPDVVIKPVVELTLAMIFNLLRKINLHTNLVKAGKWERHVGNLLYGKTVGIIGTGRIGKKISETLNLLGAIVIAYDLYPDHKWADLNKIKYKSKQKILQSSDIISLHVSPVGIKEPIINKKDIDQMKQGVLIINTSRGQFIDEPALFNGLETKKVGGVGLDVYINEPYNGNLIQFENVVFTPHVATLTKESRIAMEAEATQNLLNYFLDN